MSLRYPHTVSVWPIGDNVDGDKYVQGRTYGAMQTVRCQFTPSRPGSLIYQEWAATVERPHEGYCANADRSKVTEGAMLKFGNDWFRVVGVQSYQVGNITDGVQFIAGCVTDLSEDEEAQLT